MTVFRITRVKDDYFGFSSDIKPTASDKVRNGTIFTEINTGARFVWFDGTWEEDLTMIYAVSRALKQ